MLTHGAGEVRPRQADPAAQVDFLQTGILRVAQPKNRGDAYKPMAAMPARAT